MKAVSISSALLLACALPAAGGRPEPPPQHPISKLVQSVGVCEVAIRYGRPAVRGRTIFGEVVPWGVVWHPGSEERTTITFSHDARVQGRPIPAGTYTLFVVPTSTEWTLLFGRFTADAADPHYDPQLEALRVQARPREAAYGEDLEIRFPEVGIDTVRVELHWERVAVPFDVTFDVQAAAAEAAREFVAAATPADGRAVWSWAQYFYRNRFNTAAALEWANDLAEAAPMYFTLALQARLLALEGQPARAVAVGRLALEKAQEEAAQPGVQADAEALARELAEWEG